MADEPKKETSEHLNLKVVGQDGQVVNFKIKTHTALKKLMSAYCAKAKLAQSTVRFRFDGQPISENDTPRGLDMEDGDTIEVFQQQTGGGEREFGSSTSYSESPLTLIPNFYLTNLHQSCSQISYDCCTNVTSLSPLLLNPQYCAEVSMLL